MSLPDVERVIYKRNPLIEVISQLRFPQILKISNRDPVEFQDGIRRDYPILTVGRGMVTVDKGSESLPYQVFEESVEDQILNRAYLFNSEDLQWQVSLGHDFISLSTQNYQRYEEFKERFSQVLQQFETIYQPSFYSRVGLRYQDLIVRSNLEIEEVPWAELIPPHIAPELQAPEIVDAVVASTRALVMNIGTSQVAFQHGLVEARDANNRSESAYLLDADFFNEERIGLGNHVWDYLDKYNQAARKLFRWSISERLHLAMEPSSASGEAASG
ncbi:MAG: TIGR04255 family protein [Cyanothece sp. SIO2G6]|nr:TIGR04255 family protein [Cyanothece sp. SIO2G6]